MSAWNKDEIPSYLKPFCKHFPYQKARAYFRIYSLVISVQGLLKFTKSHIPKEAQNDFMIITLPLLVEIICEVFNFYKDPYHLKTQTANIIKEFGAESNILPEKVRGRYKWYQSMILCKYIWIMIHIENFLMSAKKISFGQIYQYCKNLERRFRHWRRGIKS